MGLLGRLFRHKPATADSPQEPSPANDSGGHALGSQTAEQQAETRRRMEAELEAQRAHREQGRATTDT